MGDVSDHFSRSEFACGCGCGFDAVDIELLTELEMVREYFRDNRITINSGCRCWKHNIAIGGSRDSQHVKGKAADIIIENISPDDVAAYFAERFPDSHGVGWYSDFTHFDVRPTKARWDNRL